MQLTGEFIDAITAEKYGLVSSVHAPEKLVEEAINLA